MDETEVEVTLAELRKEMDLCCRRLEDLEKMTNIVHQLSKEMVGLAKETGFMNQTLAQLRTKVTDLEYIPAKRWEGMVAAAVGAIVGAVVFSFF